MRTILREYRRRDFERLLAIDKAAFPPELAYSREELAAYLGARGAQAVVAEEQGAVVGYVLGAWKRDEGHVVTLDVLPEWQRLGVGGRLLAALEARLWAKGVRWVSLETVVGEASARGFYEKHGYAVIGTIAGYYDGVLDAFLMVKERP